MGTCCGAVIVLWPGGECLCSWVLGDRHSTTDVPQHVDGFADDPISISSSPHSWGGNNAQVLLSGHPQSEETKPLLGARAKLARSLIQSPPLTLVLVSKGPIAIRRHLALETN